MNNAAAAPHPLGMAKQCLRLDAGQYPLTLREQAPGIRLLVPGARIVSWQPDHAFHAAVNAKPPLYAAVADVGDDVGLHEWASAGRDANRSTMAETNWANP